MAEITTPEGKRVFLPCPECEDSVMKLIKKSQGYYERIGQLEEELEGARHEHTRLAEAADELLEALGAGPGDMPTLLREEAAHIRKEAIRIREQGGR